MVQDRTDTSTTEMGIPSLLMIAVLVIAGLVIDDGHDWRGDFAMYIEQGRALLNGTAYELYQQNKYCMDNSETNLGPYLYQPGFPMLLSIILLGFGLNFYAMKALCAASLALSIPLVFKLTRPFFKSSFYPLGIAFSVAFHASYITFTDSVLSDLPFLFFSLLTLCVITSKSGWASRLVLGVLMYFSYLIRDIGIVLLLALLAYDLHQWVRSQESRMLERLSTYAVFVLLFLVSAVTQPAGQENHFAALFTGVSLESVSNNLEYYHGLLSQYFYLDDLPSFLSYLLLVLILLGGASLTLKAPYLSVYVILSLAILFIWPYKQGIRFLFPILPFLTLFIIKGLQMVIPSGIENWLRITLGLLLLIITYFNSMAIIDYAERETNLCYTDELKEVYAFVSEEVPSNEVVVHYYPRVFRLFTGRNAVRISQYEFDLSSEYRYYQNSTDYVDPNIIAKYQVVFETENEILLKK